MELEEIKRFVGYLEDRIIINFEQYFSELILMDFYEGGFEARLSDELYFEEYFEQHESDIINLLLLIENEFDDEYENLKMKLIKMKRIIDTKLSMVSLESDNEKKIRTLSRRNISFLINTEINKEEFIQTLFKKLTLNNLINSTSENFKNHFSDNWNEKIQWLGTEIQISNFFSRLINLKILDPETDNFRNKLIATHFLNKNNNSFKEKQLGAVYSEKKEFIPTDDVTNKIIREISTHFKLT